MNKKAFTLIELLAVIVILAIISLIAVPIIIDVINDSKYESQKRSIDGYASALKSAVATYQLKNNVKVTGRFITTDGKVITREDKSIPVNYKGNVVCDKIIINKDGSIYLSKCSVDGDKIYITQEESKKENPEKYYEYGKTEYGMIEEKKELPDPNIFGIHLYKFLNTDILSARISKFSLHFEINIPEGYESKDCSYNQDGSVMCYWKLDYVDNGYDYYEMHLASDGEMYTPYNSTYLFHCLGYQTIKTKFSLEGLDTSKTTNMSHMLERTATAATELNLGDKFDTSNVTDMSYMFNHAFTWTSNFTFPDRFDTSKVTNMSHMFEDGFYGADLLDLGNSFDTSNVTDMSYMFRYDLYMSSLNLGDKFDTRNVINMSGMFEGLGRNRMRNFDLGDKFDTSNVTDMSYMFNTLGKNIKILNLGDKFNTSKVTTMSYMFSENYSLEELNLGDKFDTSNVTDMSYMFYHDKNLKTLNLGNKFNTSSVTNMSSMFCSFGYDMEIFSLGNSFDTSNVTGMSYMFGLSFKNKLKKLDLGSNFDTSNVTNMNHMFEETGYENMEELVLGNKFDTSSVKNMQSMFKNTGYKKLKKLDLGINFIRGSKYYYYEYQFDNMFEGLGHDSIEELNLHDFKFYNSNDYNRDNIFKDCGTDGVLTKVIVSNNTMKERLEQLTSPKDIPQFWKDNDIIVVE